jgi:hypothetical protein
MKETKTTPIASISFDQWILDFKPQISPKAAESGSTDQYRYDINDPAVKLAAPETVWTLLECDGLLILSHGWHFVNREGYYLSTVPHDQNSPEAEVWSFDDELQLLLDTFTDRFEVCIDPDKSTLQFLEGEDEVDSATIGDDRSVTFNIRSFTFTGKLNAMFDSLSFQGQMKNNSFTAQKRVSVFNS